MEQPTTFRMELPENTPEVIARKVENVHQAVSFAKVPDTEYEDIPRPQVPTVKDLVKMLDKATVQVGRHEFLSDLFECSAIAISNQFDRIRAQKREQDYLNIMKKYDETTRKLIVEMFTQIYILLKNQIHVGFNDYLGQLYMQSETSNNKSGQFFTPYCLSKMCAKVCISEATVNEHIEQDKILTLHEPTVGAGGMVLAAADVLYNEYHFNISRNLLVECGDIDKRCVHMTYLQLGLAGIPAVIYHRDGLSLQTWDRWETPAYIMQWLRFRNILEEK